MAIKAAKLYVEIGAETKAAEEGMSRVSKGMTQLGDIGKTALGVTLGNAITGAGQQLLGLGGEALNAYGDFERLGASLQQLAAKELLNQGQAQNMGDALAKTSGTARDLQSWIQKLAIQSPFTSQGVADAFKMSMAYGFTTQQAKRLTTAMIDFASGSGASEYAMSKIALALGQIQAKGKLAGGEVLQLTEAGIGVDRILAKAFNKTTAEIVEMREGGLIPADQAVQAIVESLERDFGGAARRQSGTISGLVSSLEDIKNLGEVDFFGPIFREFQPDLDRFVQTLQDPKTVANVRLIGQEVATTAREMVNAGGAALQWFSGLEGGTKGAVIGFGLLALNAGTVMKAMQGLFMVGSGAISAISTAMQAWNAGLSLTTSLQAGLGAMPVTLGAIAVAAAAVVGVWIAWNENIEKTNRVGKEGVSNSFTKMFDDLKKGGADAIRITDEFVAAQSRIGQQRSSSGFAGMFVDWNGMARDSIRQLSDELTKSAGSYDIYNREMMRAIESTGLLKSHTAQMIMASGDQARVQSFLAQNFGVLNQAQFDAAMGANAATGQYYQLSQAQRDAFNSMDALSASFENGGQKALEMKAAAEEIPKVLKDIEGAQKSLSDAQASWRGGVANDIVGQLDKWNVKGKNLTDAYRILDQKLGTSLGVQKRQEDSIRALVEEFAKTGNIEQFGQKVGDLQSVFEPLDTKVQSATDALSALERKLEELNGKTVTIDVKVNDGTSSGPTGTNNGRLCFVAGTPVDTPDGYCPIDEIAIGDEVITLTQDGPVVSRVARLSGGSRNDLVRVCVSDGQQYTCSPNHRFLTENRGWVVAAALVPTDLLVAIGGSRRVAGVYNTVEGCYLVYNFEVDHPDHTYCVGGVVVHNGKAAGGRVYADGEPYTVGETGIETFWPDQNGYIANASTTAQMLQALKNNKAGPAKTVNQYVTINVGSSNPTVAARQIGAELERLQR